VRAGARGGLQRSQRSRDVGQRVCTVGLGSEVRTGMRVCLDMAAEQTEQTGVGSRCSRRSDATAARGSLSLVGSRPVTGLQPTNEGDSARPEALHWHRSLGPTSVPTLSCSCLASFRRSARHLPLLSRSVACHKRAHPGPVATRLHEREQCWCQARQSRRRIKRRRRAPLPLFLGPDSSSAPASHERRDIPD
jgi:hypothetical protein